MMRTSRPRRAPRRAPLIATLFLALLAAPESRSQTIRRDLWVPNGGVYAVAFDHGVVFLGGEFDYVGPPTGHAVAIDRETGAVVGAPRVAGAILSGEVCAIAPDGDRGWFLGGDFAYAGGFARANLAHVRSDHTVTAWNPGTDGVVHALARVGSTLYVGGHFDSVGGEPRAHVAAVDALTGAVTDWNPGVDDAVQSIDVKGAVVYLGGWFGDVGGEPRSCIAAVDAGTGAVLPWAPEADDWVYAVRAEGGCVYAGGNFSTIGGEARSRIAALDIVTGTATSWNPHAEPPSALVWT
ncbi:MAG: hypothetical protein ACRDGR_10570, partial [bacterium]